MGGAADVAVDRSMKSSSSSLWVSWRGQTVKIRCALLTLGE